MTNRFVFVAEMDNVFFIVPSVMVDGIFFKVHSNAKLDGSFSARNIVATHKFLCFACDCFKQLNKLG